MSRVGAAASLAGVMVLLSGATVGVMAQSEDAAPVGFTGRQTAGACGGGESVKWVGDTFEYRGLHCGNTTTSSDPRFTGTYSALVDGDVYLGEGGRPFAALWTITPRVENTEGAWQGGPSTSVTFGDEDDDTTSARMRSAPPTAQTVIFTGEGAYEGLTAVVEFKWGLVYDTRLQGVIFGGSPPPAMAPAE